MYVDGGTGGGGRGAEVNGGGDVEGLPGERSEEVGSEEVQSGREEIDEVFASFCFMGRLGVRRYPIDFCNF